ncbi:hypothetical protein [Rhodobaculum claviforme]|uniref:Uncharacterized protein n=1 Tax=Rhodobaculum claviforme TaxID=1549854 RepID=A0A934TPV0_9RHOB|nr:hypothetical protein [Rhodobaculum claviforme]MBK5928953.1 hypothetical protein [Rhodobaculum claviforme]
MNLFWLLRMARWVRQPPSEGAVRFVLAIMALCLVLFAVERIWGWPEMLTPNSPSGRAPW